MIILWHGMGAADPLGLERAFIEPVEPARERDFELFYPAVDARARPSAPEASDMAALSGDDVVP